MPGVERTTAFLTVGSTCFDALVEVAATLPFRRTLLQAGFSHIVVQAGRIGSLPPPSPPTADAASADFYHYKPSLDDDMASAGLIISHAGAGSIMSALRLGKPLVVVVNGSLMDNHQSELAMEMQARGHLAVAEECSCDALAAAVGLVVGGGSKASSGGGSRKTVPLPPADPAVFRQCVDRQIAIL